MGFENIKNGITSDFIKYFDKENITETGVSKPTPGAEIVASKLMALSEYLGQKYGYNHKKFSEADLLSVLNEAKVTEEEVSLLMESTVGDWNDKTENKPTIDANLNEHPELIELRDKIAGALGKVKTVA